MFVGITINFFGVYSQNKRIHQPSKYKLLVLSFKFEKEIKKILSLLICHAKEILASSSKWCRSRLASLRKCSTTVSSHCLAAPQFPSVSFLCSLEYNVFCIVILHACRIHYWELACFFSYFSKTSKYCFLIFFKQREHWCSGAIFTFFKLFMLLGTRRKKIKLLYEVVFSYLCYWH